MVGRLEVFDAPMQVPGPMVCGLCWRRLPPTRARGFDHDLLEFLCRDCLRHLMWAQTQLVALEGQTGIRLPDDGEIYDLITKGKR